MMIGCWGVLASSLAAQSIGLDVLFTDRLIPKKLKHWNKTHAYNTQESLEKSRDSLSKELQLLGFLDAKLSPLKLVNDSLYCMQISAGEPIELVQIIPQKAIPRYVSKLVPPQPIPFSKVSSLLQKLINEATALGYSFASFQLNPIERKDSKLTASLEVDLGQLRTLDAIVVKGYDKFPTSFSKQAGRFFLKKPFRKRSVNEIHQVFKRLPFVSSIREPEVLFTQDSTIAYLYLKRKSNNFIEGFLGFESKETGGIRINGNLNVRLLNNLHRGEHLKLRYKNDGDAQRDFLLSIEWPYILNSPIGIESGLEIFTKDSSFVNSKQYAKLSVPLLHDLRFWTGIEFQNGSSLEEIETLPAFQTTSLRIELQKDFAVDDPYFNTRSYVKGYATWGTRNLSAKRQSHRQFGLESQYMISLSKRSQYISRLEGQALVNDELYLHELLRLGGIQSLRGFSENQLETKRYLMLNQEYRFLLSSESYLLGLVDNALVHDRVLGDQWLLGVGAGLGIRTAGGMLQLQYVLGKTPQLPFSFKDAKVHIRLSSFF